MVLHLCGVLVGSNNFVGYQEGTVCPVGQYFGIVLGTICFCVMVTRIAKWQASMLYFCSISWATASLRCLVGTTSL